MDEWLDRDKGIWKGCVQGKMAMEEAGDYVGTTG